MTVKITYETPNGTDTIERDSCHTDQAPLLTAHDDKAENLVQMPISRIVKIERQSP